MADIDIRISGRAGRITLTRPNALNALTYDMCMAIDTALRNWREDDAVDLVIFDALGEKAFCAGGDIADLYAAGLKQDYQFGRTFWQDEYRLNALILSIPNPSSAFCKASQWAEGLASAVMEVIALLVKAQKLPFRNVQSVWFRMSAAR